MAFIDRVGAHGNLCNPACAVLDNNDTRQLRGLEAAGIPIVPTFWVETPDAKPGDADAFAARVAMHGWTDIVIKPTVSAGSFMTKRFAASAFDRAGVFLRGCLDGTAAPDGRARTMMVQRYMPSVETVGERSLVWIDGAFTHAVHKHPRFDDQDEFVEATELTPDLVAFGERVMAHAPAGCRYARVDVIPRDDAPAGDGSPAWCLTELELIEPSLFFVYDGTGAAALRMARAIGGAVGASAAR